MMRPTVQEVLALNQKALANKTILITGAGDGIGKAAALDFAQHGANLILLGKTQSKLEALYDLIETTTDTQPVLFPYDLGNLNMEVAKHLADAIAQDIRSLDGLLLNAAALGKKMAIAQYPEQDWQHVMNTNLHSNFCLVQALLPLLAQSAQGRILFTTSGVGRKARGYWGAYAVSKFGIEGLMQILADELGGTSAIRTFAVNPGRTRTRMRASAFPGEHPDSNPLPQQHMPLYRFLMSDACAHYNGLSIDAAGYITSPATSAAS